MAARLSNRRLRAPDSWLPPAVASALGEHGRVEELRLYADDGDRSCARVSVRGLLAQERHVRTPDRGPWSN